MMTVEAYCHNKVDPLMDPGCFVTSSVYGANPVRLKFGCSGDQCYGQGDNFGALGSNVTCATADDSNSVRPFRSQAYLETVTWLSSGREYQQNFDICNRVECRRVKCHC